MPLADPIGIPDIPTHTGFLLAEDEAVKRAFTGITVPDRDNNPIDVGVWYRWPEGEERIKYPFITIDFVAADADYKRWRSLYHVDPTNEVLFENATSKTPGLYFPDVTPDVMDLLPSDAVGAVVEPYIPMILRYQVTHHARSAMHDRYLASKFYTDVVIPRPFWIGVDADATWRRCELLSMTPADTSETTESGSKRIFRKIYTISMECEVPQSAVSAIEQVLRVHGDIYDVTSPQRESPDHQDDDVHNIAADNWTTIPPPSS